MSHTYNFIGGNLLTKMGASWFASYWYYCNGHPNHTAWENVGSKSYRIRVFNSTKQYHAFWRNEILNMNDKKLGRNKIGLTGQEVKALMK